MENTITKCLEGLLRDLNYAIERNIESINIPLKGDVDVLIPFSDYAVFLDRARDRNLVISIARVYGGARIYIDCGDAHIKRIDCIWRLHYRGVNFLDVEKLIRKRKRYSGTTLYILPEYEQALVVYYIKNAYGGARKYKGLLEKHGFKVLAPEERREMLRSFWRKNAFRTLLNVFLYWSFYVQRIVRPTGMALAGVPVDRMREIPVINYLFQGKVLESCGWFKAVLHARILSELCITRRGHADLVVNEHASNGDIEKMVIEYLKSRSAHG